MAHLGPQYHLLRNLLSKLIERALVQKQFLLGRTIMSPIKKISKGILNFAIFGS